MSQVRGQWRTRETWLERGDGQGPGKQRDDHERAMESNTLKGGEMEEKGR